MWNEIVEVVGIRLLVKLETVRLKVARMTSLEKEFAYCKNPILREHKLENEPIQYLGQAHSM